MSLPTLILASASPRRAELLSQLDVPFQVLASNVPEVEDDHLSPFEVCQLNAHRKARAVAKKHPDAVVLGADTLVFLGRDVLGKPANTAEAEKMLKRLQGKTHQVVTGLSLIQMRSHRESVFAESTDVRFRSLTPDQISHYLAQINPLDKAGAYAIQDHGELIVEEVSGSFTNVVGLPLERLEAELNRWKKL